VPRGSVGPVPRFGVIGQVRPGKGLEKLVPLFTSHPEVGCLEIHGTFSNQEHRNRLPMVSGFGGFHDKFLTAQELLTSAARADYLLALYDDWDSRMESAVFYVAAQVDRPVICFDEGWCGRMVREYQCGIAINRSVALNASLFRSFPGPGTEAYRRLVEGMRLFRSAYSGPERRMEFLTKLTSTN
jgi:hypothetical protein